MVISKLNRNVMAFAEEVCRFAHLKYALTIHVFAYTEHPCDLLYFSLKVARGKRYWNLRKQQWWKHEVILVQIGVNILQQRIVTLHQFVELAFYQ